MGTDNPVFTPVWRVTAPLIIAKGCDARLRHCYQGDVLDWLDDEQRDHFLRMGLVARINAAPQDAIAAAAHAPVPNDAPAEPVDLDEGTLDAPAADSGAVDECVGTLACLQVPTTSGAPAARAALRGNGFRFSNAVVAAAVKHRKELSRTGTNADDEQFAVVVV